MATQDSSSLIASFRAGSRGFFVLILWLLTACLLVQAYLAGEAAMVDSALWAAHVAFVRTFAPLAPLLVAFAWLGRRSRTEKGWAAASQGFIGLQFFSAEARASVTFSWFPGVHGVTAIGLFSSCAVLCWLTRPKTAA